MNLILSAQIRFHITLSPEMIQICTFLIEVFSLVIEVCDFSAKQLTSVCPRCTVGFPAHHHQRVKYSWGDMAMAPH